MSDQIDLAQELDADFQEHAHRRVPPPLCEPWHGEVRECKNCGDELPEGRAKMGMVICVKCQQEKEK